MQKTLPLKRIIQTALLIAISIALKFVATIPVGAGLRIGPASFFSKLPAVLFGPVYGALGEISADLVFGMTQGWIPYLTITAAMGGFLVGILWKFLGDIDDKVFRKIFIIISVLFLLFGTVNLFFTEKLPNSQYSKWIFSFVTNKGTSKDSLFTYGFMAVGIIAFVLLFVDFLLRKKFQLSNSFIKLFIILLPINILVTTLNTYILIYNDPACAKLAFNAFYITRLVEECIITPLQSYAIAYLLKVYKKYNLGK